MSKSTEERVQHALQQLLERIVPTYPDEDDVTADERFEEAFNVASDIIESTGDSPLSSDVNHAADLIKRKLIRENNAPDKALQFSNLYSRLLTQPVLNHKWAMLYFLYKMADSDEARGLAEARPATLNRQGTNNTAIESEVQEAPATKRLDDRGYIVDSHAFNQAFSKTGLIRLPVSEETDAVRPAPMKREERHTASKPVNGHVRDGSTPAAPTPVADQPEREFPKEHPPMLPSEPALLRDLPFTLQGLSSANFQFES
ncbi:hypothetical protein LTS18_009651, partial [Coniosporium uncinatum]